MPYHSKSQTFCCWLKIYKNNLHDKQFVIFWKQIVNITNVNIHYTIFRGNRWSIINEYVNINNSNEKKFFWPFCTIHEKKCIVTKNVCAKYKKSLLDISKILQLQMSVQHMSHYTEKKSYIRHSKIYTRTKVSALQLQIQLFTS